MVLMWKRLVQVKQREEPDDTAVNESDSGEKDQDKDENEDHGMHDTRSLE